MKNKGQATSAYLIVVALITVGGSIFGSLKASDGKVYEVKQEVAVQATLLSEYSKRVDRLENKIDWLIQRQGGNPDLIATSTAKR